MANIKKRHVFGIAAALLAFVTLIPLSAGAAETETVIIKEKSVISDTVVDPNMPAPSDSKVLPEAPFHGKREMLPAGSAIEGTAVQGGTFGPNVINYASAVAKRTPNELVLNTMISKAEDDATLSQLASKVYMDNGGANYENVTIFWHVGEKPQLANPWGRTDIHKGDTMFKVVKIVE